MNDVDLTPETILDVIEQTYRWSRSQSYRGYNKHDALNSPLLMSVAGWSKWSRILAIQTVMRSPVNLRPVLMIPKTYNPKGLALFSKGLLNLFEFTNEDVYLYEAEQLLNLLLKIRSPGKWHGYCWGYHYPWQDLGFYAPSNTPNAVVSSFVCQAFLQAYELTRKERYLDCVRSCCEFFINDLKVLKDSDSELCLSYMPMPMTMRVMDVSILISAVMGYYNQLSNDDRYLDYTHRLCCYVIKRQTDYYAWYYTDPPEDSHITHDNYHTGFILDALWQYMQTVGSNEYQKNYENGLEYYADYLFEDDGAPRWMNDKDFPRDIHGAAQGIITFSRHPQEFSNLSDNITRWVLENLYHPSGRFYYQQGQIFKKRFTLLRWCNAWMAMALTTRLLNNKKANITNTPVSQVAGV